jgi:hypothetical protein
MRLLVGTLVALTHVQVESVKLGDYDPIIIPGLDAPMRDTTGSMSFNPSSQYFSIDTGSSQIPRFTPAQSPVAAAIGAQVDYQMSNTEFLAPTTSYTSTLDKFVPPVFSVKGCKPSDGRSSCKKGKEATYNLATPNPRAASASR